MRPILFPENSVNQISVLQQPVPLGPWVIASGPLEGVGTAYSVNMPLVLKTPILFAVNSVNQSDWLSPTTIPRGPALGVGTEASVMLPAGSTRPILLALNSVKLTLPRASEN